MLIVYNIIEAIFCKYKPLILLGDKYRFDKWNKL